MEDFLLVEAAELFGKYSGVTKANKCDICKYRPGQTKSSRNYTNVVDTI